ncbi:hypothetical protein V5G24_19655 [Xanthobacter sp. VTT E-85241]|uniref:hypothetical protein n=1 Tax=Roseixanthobacter finlandensis TaxID=3119922 RepID=UPI00372BE0A6
MGMINARVILAAAATSFGAATALAGNDPVIDVIGQSSCSYDSSSVTYTCTASNADETTAVNVNNGQVSGDTITTSTDVTISGTGNFEASTNYNTGFFYAGWGQQKNTTYGGNNGYTDGGNITISASGSQTVSQFYAMNLQYSFEGTTGDGNQNVYWGSGVGALVGLSIGGGGVTENSDTNTSDYNGGSGGRVEITNTGSFTAVFGSQYVTNSNIPNIPISGNAIAALSFGGNGTNNKTSDTDFAGGGGAGGAVTVTNEGTVVASSALSVPTIGILAVSQGGVGSNQKSYASAPGGNGGSVSVVNDGSISIDAPEAIGIVAASLGGNSNFDTDNNGEDASGAGNGGSASVTLNSGSSITFAASGSTGIGAIAVSAGGNANNSEVGQGGSATVTVNSGATIDTSGAGGDVSIGAMAVSAGSTGSLFLQTQSSGYNADYPGSAGDATVNNYGTINTKGTLAVGVAALSIGGAAIVSASDVGPATLGNTGAQQGALGGSTATVNNTGAITTLGSAAYGILAASIGGGGGIMDLESSDQTATLGSATDGGGTGNGGSVVVTHSGSIVTGDGSGTGAGAVGIVAQSIGGGGGSSSAGSLNIGAQDKSGSGGGKGGSVSVTLSDAATIVTQDDNALGILAQSVGGGGGNGASNAGLFSSTGGAGGNGGAGGAVTVDLENTSGYILTSGLFAGGVYAQSVGGGGGNGGASTSFGTIISDAMGGTGGSGGAGGTVTVTNDTAIISQGNQSLGILAQSVGGGGGTGGAANSYSAGVLTVSLAVGGAGGDGGAGGAVTVTHEGAIYTGCSDSSGCVYEIAGAPTPEAADSIGILAQSIGGGGGAGGSATAYGLSFSTEEIPVNFTFTYAVGGSGGSGGDGGTVSVNQAGRITTGADGAFGILAQSIGGGGGIGGDASASSYALETGIATVKLALSYGGTGGDGGSGGDVNVTVGPTGDCSTCNGTIVTYGHYAHGILAQSIGGGGGAGGAGDASASSPNTGGTGTSVTLTYGLGGNGGGGDDGGGITVTVDAGSAITTYGSSASAILAQSIGGGGGMAGGGSASASGDSYEANIAVGGLGGTGSDGGTVSVNNAGTISTGSVYTNSSNLSVVMGGDSFGIFAQSIGGGGGSGGTSDAAANIDLLSQVQDAINTPSASYSADISLGGSGGAAGDGGAVNLTNSGSITTIGQRAFGMFGQSIGGGGGYGGAATSTSNSVIGGPSAPGAGTYSADLAVGGNGSGGGDGGAVSFTNSGAITTSGYGAHAMFAQSIGGGGGFGAEGTVDNITTVGLGASYAGSGSYGGDGGQVSVTDTGTLWTAGDDAFGIFAQSVGAGGGSAGVGCSNSVQVGPIGNSQSLCLGNSQVGVTTSTSIFNDASDFTLNVGGQNGLSGNGGDVTIAKTSGAIITAGARAFGIAAQSIGGGGGLVSAASANVGSVTFDDGDQGGVGGASGSGGTVSVTLGDGVAVTTYGAGAFGVFAQSVGGGGGFAGDASLALATTNVNNLSYSGQFNTAGAITVTTSADIATSGANAHGLFLQSIADASGGAIGMGDTLTAGGNLSGTLSTSNGTGGSITVNQDGGSIVTSGAGAVAIFAQSSGNDTHQNPITINISGLVQGGTGASAAGVWLSGGISGGGESEVSGVAANTITINEGGSLSTTDGINGRAILAQQSITNVFNSGTLTGSVDLGQESYDSSAVVGTITNYGLFNAGSAITAASLSNNGTLAPGGVGTVMATTLSGGFTQSSSGILAVDINATASPEVDLLLVGGTASIDGTIDPTASALLPGSYEIVQAASLSTTATTSASYLFTWDVTATTTSLSISPDANFTPSGAGLSTNEQALANYLQASWNAGGSSGLAPLYGTLSQVESASAYASDLDQIIANVSAAVTNQALASTSALDSAFSCPVFEGTGTLLGESSCAWSSVTGSTASLGGGRESPAQDLSTLTFRLGGQKEIAPDWYLGATAGYSWSWTETSGTGSGDGQRGDAGLALKHTMGPWYFGAGFNLAYGRTTNERSIDLIGPALPASSASNVFTASGRVRAAYEFAFANWYLRPHVDLDVIYVDAPGYSEASLSPLAFDVSGQSDTLFGLSAMVEAGGRVNLDSGWILRPYAAVGVSLLSQDTWTTQVKLQGAPAGLGTFDMESDIPDVLFRLDAGLQLYQQTGAELKAIYGLSAGNDYLSNTGSLRFSYRF